MEFKERNPHLEIGYDLHRLVSERKKRLEMVINEVLLRCQILSLVDIKPLMDLLDRSLKIPHGNECVEKDTANISRQKVTEDKAESKQGDANSSRAKTAKKLGGNNKSNPLLENSSTKEVTNPIDVLMESGCQKLSSGSLSEAILKFDEAAELMKADEANKGTQDGLIIIHYLMALSLCQTSLPENVCKAHRVLSRATESSTLDSFGYRNLMTCLAFANFLRRDYDAAQQNLNKVQETGKALDFETNNVELPFKFDVVSDNLKSDLLTLNPDYLKDVHNFLQHSPKPDGTCRYTNCIKVNHDPIFGLVPSTSIYCNEFKDIDFKGMHTLHCDNKCSINFHTKCWKSHKVENMTVKDIDMLGQHCMTPDCKGVINEISIIKDDGSKVQLNDKKSASKPKATKHPCPQRPVITKQTKPTRVVEKKKKKASDPDQSMVSSGIHEVDNKDQRKATNSTTTIHKKTAHILPSSTAAFSSPVQENRGQIQRTIKNQGANILGKRSTTKSLSKCEEGPVIVNQMKSNGIDNVREKNHSDPSVEFGDVSNGQEIKTNNSVKFSKDSSPISGPRKEQSDTDQIVEVGACSLLYQELGPEYDNNDSSDNMHNILSVCSKKQISNKTPAPHIKSSPFLAPKHSTGAIKKRVDQDYIGERKKILFVKEKILTKNQGQPLRSRLLPGHKKQLDSASNSNVQLLNQDGRAEATQTSTTTSSTVELKVRTQSFW